MTSRQRITVAAVLAGVALVGSAPATAHGIGGRTDELDLQGDELQSIECIIQSMTKEERRRPEILNTSRRRRIAVGSGRTVDEVSDLLKQFKQMQGVMQQLKQLQGGGLMSKFKGMRAIKKQMEGQSPDEIMRQMGQNPALAEGPTGGPALPGQNKPQGAMPPGGLMGALAGGQQQPKRPGKARPAKDDIRKKRKAERQRKKKQRKK